MADALVTATTLPPNMIVYSFVFPLKIIGIKVSSILYVNAVCLISHMSITANGGTPYSGMYVCKCLCLSRLFVLYVYVSFVFSLSGLVYFNLCRFSCAYL